jgi:hypothetical protein
MKSPFTAQALPAEVSLQRWTRAIDESAVAAHAGSRVLFAVEREIQ